MTRRSTPRAKTLAVRKITRAELHAGFVMYPPVDVQRPRTWGECAEILEAGPCPFVGCRHHLYLDINPDTGSIKINFPDLEPWELNHSCSLYAAELGIHTLDAVGARMNITRERTRQVEQIGMTKLKAWIEIQRARDEVAA